MLLAVNAHHKLLVIPLFLLLFIHFQSSPLVQHIKSWNHFQHLAQNWEKFLNNLPIKHFFSSHSQTLRGTKEDGGIIKDPCHRYGINKQRKKIYQTNFQQNSVLTTICSGFCLEWQIHTRWSASSQKKGKGLMLSPYMYSAGDCKQLERETVFCFLLREALR